MVGQPSNYQTSVPVHHRNPRLARVQRGLLIYTERSPHEWEPSSRFYLLVYLDPDTQRLILTRCRVNLDLFRCFSGGGPSHRLRTNLSIIVCYIFRIALLLSLFLRVVGKRGGLSLPLGQITLTHLVRSPVCFANTFTPSLSLSYYGTTIL